MKLFDFSSFWWHHTSHSRSTLSVNRSQPWHLLLGMQLSTSGHWASGSLWLWITQSLSESIHLQLMVAQRSRSMTVCTCQNGMSLNQLALKLVQPFRKLCVICLWLQLLCWTASVNWGLWNLQDATCIDQVCFVCRFHGRCYLQTHLLSICATQAGDEWWPLEALVPELYHLWRARHGQFCSWQGGGQWWQILCAQSKAVSIKFGRHVRYSCQTDEWKRLSSCVASLCWNHFACLLHILNMIFAKHLFAADFDFVLICQL